MGYAIMKDLAAITNNPESMIKVEGIWICFCICFLFL